MSLLDIIMEADDKIKELKKEQSKKAPKKVKEKRKLETELRSDEEDYEIQEPSLQQINEGNKVLAKLSTKETIRSKKRKIYETQQESKRARTKTKIEEYLHLWKEEKDKFKYQKARQIYIQKFIFDKTRISDEIWEVTVEYCQGIQGNGKQIILEKAKKIIEELDEKTTGKSDQETVLYERAREVLQNLA